MATGQTQRPMLRERAEERAAIDAVIADGLSRRLQAELIANSARLPAQYQDAWRLADSITVKPEEASGARLLLCIQAYGEGACGRDRARPIERAAEAAMSEVTDGDSQTRVRTGRPSIRATLGIPDTRAVVGAP